MLLLFLTHFLTAKSQANRYHEARLVYESRLAGLERTEKANAAAVDKATLDRWQAEYDSPLPKRSDKKFVDKFACRYLGMSEWICSPKAFFAVADTVTGVRTQAEFMEDALAGERHISVAVNPDMGPVGDVDDLVREGCRLDVEA